MNTDTQIEVQPMTRREHLRVRQIHHQEREERRSPSLRSSSDKTNRFDWSALGNALDDVFSERAATSHVVGSPRKIDDISMLGANIRRCRPGHIRTETITRCALPDCILEPWLYLGDMEHALDKPILKKLGITNVINLTNDVECLSDNEIRYLHLPIVDSIEETISDVFEQAIAFLVEVRERGERVLVHCREGSSRSPTIVIAYLMAKQDMSLKVARAHCTRIRPIVHPNSAFWLSLQQFENSLNSDDKKLHQLDMKQIDNLFHRMAFEWRHHLEQEDWTQAKEHEFRQMFEMGLGEDQNQIISAGILALMFERWLERNENSRRMLTLVIGKLVHLGTLEAADVSDAFSHLLASPKLKETLIDVPLLPEYIFKMVKEIRRIGGLSDACYQRSLQFLNQSS